MKAPYQAMRPVFATFLIVIFSLPFTGCATWRAHRPFAAKAAPVSVERELNLARLAERQENPSKARELYKYVLEHEATNPVALHRMGVMEGRAGRVDLGIDYLRRAMEQTPTDQQSELRTDIGYLQYVAGDFQGAESTLTDAFRDDPTNKRLANNLAMVLGIQGRYDDSLSVFRVAGTEAEAVANLAYIKSQRGDIDGAIEGYHEALQRDGDLRIAANALVQLNGKSKSRLQRQDFRRPVVESDRLIAQRLPNPTPSIGTNVQQVAYEEQMPVSTVGAYAAPSPPAPTPTPTAVVAVPAQPPRQLVSLPTLAGQPQPIAPPTRQQVQPIATQAFPSGAVDTATADLPVRTQMGETWFLGNSDQWSFGLSE
jgi:Tfp pilus assembly protein PilF